MIRELFLRDLSLWTCLWQSSVFAGLGLIAGRLLRHRPARAYQALLLAMATAVAVPLLSALVKHSDLGAFVARPTELSYAPPEMAFAMQPVPPRPMPAGVVEPAPFRIPWPMVLRYGWLAATLALLARLVVAFLYGVHLVRHASRASCDQVQRAVDSAASKLAICWVLKVRASRRIHSPLVWCWSRLSILLVPNPRDDSQVDWGGVAAHELAHCKRRDHITGLAAEVLASLLPWNPLMWLSRRMLIRLGEQACDDWVVASGQSSEDYAESLLHFRPQRQPAFWPAVVSSRGGLAHRIRRILNDACGNPRAGAKWVLTLSIATLGIGLGVAFAQTRPTFSEASSRPEERAALSLSLHKAAAAGNLEQVNKLLAQGADVNEKDKDSSTPLHEAAGNGWRDVARLLLEKGANVEAADASGQTPLHRASRFGSRHICALLLAKGASVKATDNLGNTPLHTALGRQAVDRSLFELLLAQGADVKARNEQGETPLHLACKARRAATYTQQRAEAADVLLAHGAEVDATDKSGCTPLHVAVENGQEKVVGLLLAKGADVRTKAADGTTLLHRAVKKGQLDMVELFLNRGIDVNIAQSDGRTALHLAVGTGKNNIVEALIARGADVKARDVHGETPAGLAARSNRKDTIHLLLDKGAEVSTIGIAAYIGDLDAVKGFLERGGNVTAQDKYLTSTLCAAAMGGQKDVAAFLISKGASVNVEDVGRVRMGALHFAAVGGSREVAELLIANGAEVNAGDATPLWYAAQSGAKDVALLLIDHGADVNAKLQDGWTPLHVAACNGDKDLVLLLLDRGADIDAKDGRSETPLETAGRAEHLDVVRLLIDKGANVSSPDDLLYPAVWRGDKQLTEALIKKGANVDAQSRGWGGYSVSLYALWDDRPHTSVLELLLAHGANPNANDGDWYLLHYAAQDAEVTRLLLDKGANPNVIDNTGGKSPLHVSAKKGCKPAVELLVARGANPNLKDYDGRTPLALAREQGHNEIVEFLRQHGAKE